MKVSATEYAFLVTTLQELKKALEQNEKATKILDMKLVELETRLNDELENMEKVMSPDYDGLSRL